MPLSKSKFEIFCQTLRVCLIELVIGNFFANLKSLLYEYSNEPNFESIVTEAIVNAANKYMPSIVVTGVTATFIDTNEKNDLNRIGLAMVRIKVDYSIPRFKSPKLALEVDMAVGG